LIDDLRGRFGRRVALEFRMGAAFFQRGILHLLAALECGYAIKMGYWSWLPLKATAAACRRWQPVAPNVTGHETELVIPQWQTSGSGWCCTGSTSTTRRAGTSSGTCSPRMMGTTSTRR
jgi:hypothetical protein